MAGGEGTRLRPLTSLRPKPMVPIVNQPCMEHILGLVKHHGMTEVVATLQFMPQVIQDYFGGGEEWGTEIAYAVEETPLGTAGSVRNAAEHLTETFLVISGDALTDVDLSEVIAFHERRGAAVTIALKSVPDPLEFGVVIADDEGRIQRFLEKPTWGQVFSDTINTGIYVLEPEVFEHIPEDEPYDFSSQLFPDLMRKGLPLYGCVVDGYWCDVGSLESYVQAHRDVLDGRAKLYVPGTRTTGDVWIGEGAQVQEGAVLRSKVVVGANAKIRGGAELAEYTVLGDNCVIGHDSVVERSILWNDTFVGAGATVRGAVLCRRVDVRKRATVEVGVAIGDEAMVGHDAFIGNDVQIYPFKRIEPAAVVSSSVIWETAALRSLFGTEGISGLVGVDVTPESALKAAQAFGTTLPSGSHVVMSRDNSRAARMIKRAMVAGLNSAGLSVRDLRVASPAVNRFTTRDTRSVGGVHVCASPKDVQSLQIQFYGANGLDITPWEQKKVERLYFRNEFRRSFLSEVGEIIYPPRALEYYAQGLSDALRGAGRGEGREAEEEPEEAAAGRRLRVVADMGFGVASIVLPQVATGWPADLLTLNPIPDAEKTYVSGRERTAHLDRLRTDVEMFGADLGIRFDLPGERIDIVTPAGRMLDGDTALHLMVALWCGTGRAASGLVVPAHASVVVDEIAARCGARVVRSGRSRQSLAETAVREKAGFAGGRNGCYVFPALLAACDGIMSLGMLVRMLSETEEDLDAVVERLPAPHLREKAVFCPIDRKGAVMRAVTEAVAGMDVRLADGVRVTLEDGWALVLPHPFEPLVDVYAEGVDDASADENLARFERMVSGAAG
ncbi:MAG: NTP transferase domain-containing protein [Coriobacteriia bacterium]|nr:NTP transferase domain-containing protein [Coriobacteriia bacterium]